MYLGRFPCRHILSKINRQLNHEQVKVNEKNPSPDPFLSSLIIYIYIYSLLLVWFQLGVVLRVDTIDTYNKLHPYIN